MTIIKVVSGAMVVIFIIFGLMALATGAQLNKSDLLNGAINEATARQIDAETLYKSKIDELNLQEKTAETEAHKAELSAQAEKARAQAQLEIQRLEAQLQQDLTFRQGLHDLALILLGLAITALIGVLSANSLIRTYASVTLPQPPRALPQARVTPKQPAPQTNPTQAKPVENHERSPWDDSAFRAYHREAARQHERNIRESAARIGKPPSIGNGKKGSGDARNLPRA